MNVIAIIPARGGSKSIPGKNIHPVGGKPLLVWSIEQARQVPLISRVFVSTDSPEIAAIARDYGAEVIPRPYEISGDTASSESCLVHALEYLERANSEQRTVNSEQQTASSEQRTANSEEKGVLDPQVSGFVPHPSFPETQVSGFRSQPSVSGPPDLVVFLQATSPMREPNDIQRAIETLERENADSLFSACRVEGFTWRLRDGSVSPVNYDPTHRPRRQNLQEEIWEENGSFYIFKPWVLRKLNSRLGGKIAMYPMAKLNSFQIDEPEDLELMEQLINIKQKLGKQKTESGNTDYGLRTTDYGRQRTEDRSQMSEDTGQKSEVRSQKSSGQWSVVSCQLSRIKLLVLDFDGVLTDNRVLVNEDGKEAVLCDRGDGLGIGKLKAAGIEVVVISKERNSVVAARCRKLGIECIQGCDAKLHELQKMSVVRGLKSEDRVEGGNLKPEEIAYVGNDINDLECLRWVGLPIAVADAVSEVKSVAKWVTSKPGGRGAVREVCDHILQSRDAKRDHGLSFGKTESR